MFIHSTITSWAVTHPYYSLTVTLCLYFAGLAIVRYSRRKSERLPYPPGPKGYPMIGSLLEAPTERPWLTYAKWGITYGELLDKPSLLSNSTLFQPRRHGFLQSARPTNPHLE